MSTGADTPGTASANTASASTASGATRRARLRRWIRRGLVLGIVGAILVALAVTPPAIWISNQSGGRVHADVASAPGADVVIVFGAQVADDRRTPLRLLAARLAVAADLVKAGKVKAVLVSGDANGRSGNEIEVMTNHLIGLGVPAEIIVGDDYGLDSYDTCRRARDVFGITRALLASQDYHLRRAVTLCRSMGVDAHGVDAGCPDCTFSTKIYNPVRELPAGVKAAYEVWRARPPAVISDRDRRLDRFTQG